ncbi:radical SAM protein [Candidatus Sumerlaeota bacterium]|nr:radical SAM protein [Candidatus Sumerlaeota bacterium]
MISITKLYCGGNAWGDSIRYGEPVVSGLHSADRARTPRSAAERRPVVVWNITRRCNLHCLHCYTDSQDREYPDELTTDEGKRLLDDLAEFSVPVVLFSGGEPLTRPDVWTFLEHARKLKLRTVLSTNGTLIDNATAEKLKALGVAYVGVSLDGIGEVNDRFRGKKGAFDSAVNGIKSCARAGLRVGLRLTLTRHNVECLNDIFDFVSTSPIERICFYHLIYSGRARKLKEVELTQQETRKAIDTIINRSDELFQLGMNKEVLTVDNHVDGVYIYLRLPSESKKNPEKARQCEEVRRLLEWNGGGLYSSGVGIGAIDSYGNVHPDQFWSHYTLGNVRDRPFSQIWQDQTEPLLYGLRHRREYIKGRCRLCQWFEMCGGAMRVRADLIYADPWAPEPACYLSDEEIGLDENKRQELMESNEIFTVPEFLLGHHE